MHCDWFSSSTFAEHYNNQVVPSRRRRSELITRHGNKTVLSIFFSFCFQSQHFISHHDGSYATESKVGWKKMETFLFSQILTIELATLLIILILDFDSVVSALYKSNYNSDHPEPAFSHKNLNIVVKETIKHNFCIPVSTRVDGKLLFIHDMGTENLCLTLIPV